MTRIELLAARIYCPPCLQKIVTESYQLQNAQSSIVSASTFGLLSSLGNHLKQKKYILLITLCLGYLIKEVYVKTEGYATRFRISHCRLSTESKIAYFISYCVFMAAIKLRSCEKKNFTFYIKALLSGLSPHSLESQGCEDRNKMQRAMRLLTFKLSRFPRRTYAVHNVFIVGIFIESHFYAFLVFNVSIEICMITRLVIFLQQTPNRNIFMK